MYYLSAAGCARPGSARSRCPGTNNTSGWRRSFASRARRWAGIRCARRRGVTWSPDGKSFDFDSGGKRYRFDVATKKISATAAEARTQRRPGRTWGGGGQPARGRQFDFAVAPAGNHRAIYKDRNVWVGDSTGANAVQITTDGSARARIKYGTASWVYGEELAQRTAMWWSPDGKKLAYYRFDESKVRDYYLHDRVRRRSRTRSTSRRIRSRAFRIRSSICSCTTWPRRRSTHIDVRDGKPFENDVVGHYVYRVAWSPDGNELTFTRTNRRQNTHGLGGVQSGDRQMPRRRARGVADRVDRDDRRACSSSRTATGSSGNRSATASRTTICTISSGKLIAPLTQNCRSKSAAIVRRRRERRRRCTTSARDGDNYMKLQLHRVGLDGKDDMRLTDPRSPHQSRCRPTASISSTSRETHDRPPVTRLVDANGKVVAELAKSDLTQVQRARPEEGRDVHVSRRRRQDDSCTA